MPSPKNRNWCFTYNNPTVLPEQYLEDVSRHTRHVIFQLERGTSGTNHYQGCCSFTNAVRASTVKRYLGNSVHVEIMRGTYESARVYSSKAETRIEGKRLGSFSRI